MLYITDYNIYIDYNIIYFEIFLIIIIQEEKVSMFRKLFWCLLFIFVFFLTDKIVLAADTSVIPGDNRIEEYLPMLSGKRVALFCNHTAIIEKEHLLDVLLKEGVQVTALFSPEHGIRGDIPAGDSVDSGTDSKTGIPILSLYDGDTVMPTEKDMANFDVLVIDIQDVGLRYYTYHITVCDLIEVCTIYQNALKSPLL